MARIFISHTIPDAAAELLRARGHDVTVRREPTPVTPAELRRAVQEYEALIVLLTDKIDRDILQAAGPQLKVIANYAVGYDNIDVAEASARNIIVTNTPDVLNEAVAEHTITLMLALAHRIVEADAFVRSGQYQGWQPMLLLGWQLFGKTLGIVGVGRIGGHVARLARGLGMNVAYHDLKPNDKLEKAVGATYHVTLDTLLPAADVVSIHVPLTTATHHLLNEQRLKQMKPSALLVNTSRGPVIDETALVHALEQKTIWGAALDVFEQEPKLTAGLAFLANVIITPHIASATIETRSAMARLCAENILNVLQGQPPRTPVHA